MKTFITAGALALSATAMRSASTAEDVALPTMMLDQVFEPATARINNPQLSTDLPC
tara:strand:- start:1050 stop:1217 length:168 start_codon:yes stop_codon:yes gene_type:complete